MRHKYATTGIVLARFPQGEANFDVLLVTPEFGLLRARAQGLRKAGAKLSAALQTFSESDVSLVRGKDLWRLSGAALVTNWSSKFSLVGRKRVGRIAELVLRLVRGETNDPALFAIFKGFFAALPTLTEEEQDAAECLTALRVLRSLGLDAGEIPGADGDFEEAVLTRVKEDRRNLILRVNRGISASGL